MSVFHKTEICLLLLRLKTNLLTNDHGINQTISEEIKSSVEGRKVMTPCSVYAYYLDIKMSKIYANTHTRHYKDDK